MNAARRRSLGAWWLARARAELDASGQFEIMARRLEQRAAPVEIVSMARRAVGEELRHSELCLELAASYLGEAAPALSPNKPDEPSFGVAAQELTTTLHVVLSSCISESIATAFLRVCLAQAESASVRSALRSILEDEIGHARLGWAYLATLAEEEKREVGRAIPALIRTGRDAWLATETPPDRPRGHGSLSRADLESVVSDAIANLVMPGFAHLGIR